MRNPTAYSRRDISGVHSIAVHELDVHPKKEILTLLISHHLKIPLQMKRLQSPFEAARKPKACTQHIGASPYRRSDRINTPTRKPSVCSQVYRLDRKFPSKTCSAEPGPMDRAASAKIAGCAVNPPRLRSAAFRVQPALDSKTYYLPLPIIRYDHAGKTS
jgi:hypothetical protein